MNTPEPPPDSQAPASSAPASGKWLGILTVCGLLAAGAGWWAHIHGAAAAPKSAAATRGEVPPVPVVAGVVAQKDVPIYLDGLGTVQAFNTVTVRARVDGQVVKVAFTEGQDVHVDDVLAQIDPAPYRALLAQAVAKQGQDEAQLANAQTDLQRYHELLAKEGVTQQVFDTQKSLVHQLEAAIKSDQALVDSANVQLAYTIIRSPIDGRTGIRLVDQGNLVRATDATGLVVITQLHPISVVFTLREGVLGKIQKQLLVNPDLSVLALDSNHTELLGEGKLAVIDNQIDITTGTIKLKATFPNTDLRLWPGQFVNARLRLSVRQASAVVPTSTVQRGPEGSEFVFVIKEDHTVEIRPVKVAQTEQGEALIEDGLHPGEQVVVDGQYKLQKGSRVTAAAVAAASARSADPGPKKAKQ
ncbi:MAG: efflux RND transporter periplasmic adaptor subunit [Verrucomicrobiota bacterium]